MWLLGVVVQSNSVNPLVNPNVGWMFLGIFVLLIFVFLYGKWCARDAKIWLSKYGMKTSSVVWTPEMLGRCKDIEGGV